MGLFQRRLELASVAFSGPLAQLCARCIPVNWSNKNKQKKGISAMIKLERMKHSDSFHAPSCLVGSRWGKGGRDGQNHV